MGFFSKLFKNDEDAPADAQEQPPAHSGTGTATGTRDAAAPTPAASAGAGSKAEEAGPSPVATGATVEPEAARPAAPRPPAPAAAPGTTAARSAATKATPPFPAAVPPPMGAVRPAEGAAAASAARARAAVAVTRATATKPAGAPKAAPPPLKLGGAAATGRTTPKPSRASAAELAAQPQEAKPSNGAARAPATSATAERAGAALPVSPPAAEAALDDAVDAAVDRLLDAAETQADAAVAEAEREADRRAAAETFHAMVVANAAQVRELMFQLSMGRTPRKWALACRPVIAPFLAGARQIELSDLSDALAQLDAALGRAAAEPGAYIRPETASAIEASYGRLSALLPQAFTANDDGDGRRLLLLESLLLQVPAMSRRALNKLYSAGLGSLDRLGGAAAEEISAVAGLDRGLARAVAERVQEFERERSRLDSAELRPQARERLRSVLARLRRLQEDFEHAELEEAAERKRAARRAREAAAREVDALLAQVGELHLIEELRRCAVRSKITRLESYLEPAPASA